MSDEFVGIDVSKDWLDVAVVPSEQTWRCRRDHAGLDELVDRLRALQPAAIAMEASGGYEIAVAASLADAQLPVHVVNARQSAILPRRRASSPKRIVLTPSRSLGSLRLCAQKHVRSRTCPRADSSRCSFAGVSWWT